jgi:hypothetical protein
LSLKEPSPSPTRDGTTLVTQKANDSKGEKIMGTQAQREAAQRNSLSKKGDF